MLCTLIFLSLFNVGLNPLNSFLTPYMSVFKKQQNGVFFWNLALDPQTR